MSRYSEINLSELPAQSGLIDLDFDAIFRARMDELQNILAENFTADQVADIMTQARDILSSPSHYLNKAAAARELYLSNRINEAVRSVLLVYARGVDLDYLGLNKGLSRKIIAKGEEPEDTVYENDDAYRARIQLANEAYSPHGTEGSYVYWALEADNVADAVVYGPNHDLDPPILPAEPKLVILSQTGNGAADSELINEVYQNCSADKRRPVGDKLTVVSAIAVNYQIEANLYVSDLTLASQIKAEALAAIERFTSSRLRIGRTLYRSSIAAALKVPGVVDVDLTTPSANIVSGPYDAPYCTQIALAVQPISDSWRDV